MPSLLDPGAALADAHPGWTVSCEGGIWQAVSRPTPHTVEVLIGPSFETLTEKLEQEDAP